MSTESVKPNTPSPSSVSSADRSPAPTRRGFLRTGTAATAGVAAITAAPLPAVHASEEAKPSRDKIRIGLIGAGGRGSGAINNSLTINSDVEFAAVADLNEDKLASIKKSMERRHEGKVAIKESSMYAGIDAYKNVLDDKSIDLVLFATPPGFRPQYVLDAVQAGKHVFAEKPTCVDPAGYRVCVVADELARKNGTAIVTGTQYRRQTNYVEAINKIHAGEIGEVVGMTARYCSNSIWFRPRREGMSDTEYQIFNWMHFIWLSGDQIAEQAVHNIDVMNWVMQGPPVSAYGSGGRFTRPEGSEMWDSMSIDYDYGNGRFVSFKCRQIPNSKADVGNVIYGSEGTATILGGNSGASISNKSGEEVWSMPGNIGAAYEQEHKDLCDSIRAGKPIVEFKETANSSLTAVIGRMAAYTGQRVTWDFATNESQLKLFPDNFDINGDLVSHGHAIPGQNKLV